MSIAQRLPRLADPSKESRMMLEAVLKPAILAFESDQDPGRLPMTRNDNLAIGARRRKRDKSSLTTARATSRRAGAMLREPRFGFFLRDDREDLDFLADDVIEHPELVHPKPELRLRQATQPLDATLSRHSGHQSRSEMDEPRGGMTRGLKRPIRPHTAREQEIREAMHA
jgi:hypothetical protein